MPHRVQMPLYFHWWWANYKYILIEYNTLLYLLGYRVKIALYIKCKADGDGVCLTLDRFRTTNILQKGGVKMPVISAFYSVNEIKKPADQRVYHDNSLCRPGQDIPANERRSGTGGYRQCDKCAELGR
jgi:hypothetical protein